jgi:MFS family permease
VPFPQSTPNVTRRDPSVRIQRQLGAYFGTLMLTLGLAEPTGLVSLPVLFWLKDGLQLGPKAIAIFEAVALAPLYVGFVFGFVRDRWRPFGRGDHGYFLIAAPIAIASYLWLATNTTSALRMLAGIVVAMLAFEFLAATTEGLMTEAAQRHVLTGHLSAVAEIAEIVPSIASMLLGGWLATHVGARASFLLAAGFTGVILVQTLLHRPAALAPESTTTPDESHRHAIRRLLRNRALWPAIGALLLWNFSPGWGTPLVFFFSDTLKLSPEAFGAFRAATFAGGGVAAIVYATLCRRYSLRRILWITIALNIPAAFFVLLAHNTLQAVAISAFVGLLLGLVNIALFDLLRRSCPTSLEGTGVMLGYSLFAIGGMLGDVFGSWLYERAGLAICLAFDALATALILPLLLLIPRSLISSRDGDAEPPAMSRPSMLAPS